MNTASRNHELRKTARHSAIYAVGTVLRRISGLVVLPIYTRYLTPSDYGVVELLTIFINVMGILVGLRMGQALLRYYILEDREGEKRLVVSTVLLTVMATSGIGTLLAFLASTPLSRFLFGSADYVYEFNLFLLTLATNAIAGVGMSYLRARQMPVVFVSVGAAVLILEIVLNIYFVVVLELHVTGVVYSTVISGVILATGLSLFLINRTGIRYSWSLAAELIRFVAPLILAAFGSIYVTFSNRYFLRMFGDLEDVGLFALAARLSSVLGVAFEAFNMSWTAHRFEIVKKDNAREIYGQVFRFLSAIILLTGAGLAIFADDFFRIMTDPVFYPAARLVPILIVAAIFRMCGGFCGFGAAYFRESRIMAEASWSKALIATVAFLLLIPPMGVFGAAIGLLLGNAVEFAWIYKRSKALYDMGLQWRPVLSMAVCAAFMTLVTLPLQAGEWVFFVLRLLAYALLVFLVCAMPVWRQDERDMIKSAFHRLIRPAVLKSKV